MRPLILILFTHSFLFFGQALCAQEIIAKDGSYGVDKKNKIIVWHANNLDSILSNNKEVTGIRFNEIFRLNDTSKQLSYSEAISVTNSDSYSLYISKLPLVHMTIDTSNMNNTQKIPGCFTFYKDNEYVKSIMGVRHRGNLSLSFPKKSFDLEFWTDSISKLSKMVKFKGMRSDDDWILDGVYNEPLHLRSYVASNLWSKIHKPYYKQKEPKAESGFEVKFVEVFKNNEYYGIYQLSESINRKQLRLKKYIEKTIYGELYKADSYEGAPAFIKVPSSYNNLFPHWGGFQTRYPLIDYEANWENLSKFVNLVVNGTDEDFLQNIEDKVHISNAIDYYLLVNVLGAGDNLGKNYYLGKYDKNEPYFFIPWDLDGVLGVVQQGKRLTTTDAILSNGLFDRLLKINPNGYTEKVKTRWTDLRTKEFGNEALLSRIDKIYNKFTKEQIYEREQLVWKNALNDVSNENHYDYLKKWLNDRLSYLDAHFDSL